MQGVVLVTSAFIIVANIVVDVLYGVIDPRVTVVRGDIAASRR